MHLRLHRPGRPGPRLRAGLRSGELRHRSSGSFPTANIFFEDGLSSPVTREFTLSIGRQLWTRRHGEGDLHQPQLLRTSSRTSSTIRRDAGRTDVVFNGTDFGTFDNIVYRNSDVPERNYQALLFQANYRPSTALIVRGALDAAAEQRRQLRGRGGQPAGRSARRFGDYPEILVPIAQLPDRTAERFPAPQGARCGRSTTSRSDASARSTSRRSCASTRARPTACSRPTCRSPTSSWRATPATRSCRAAATQTLFFGERGCETFPGFALLDLGRDLSGAGLPDARARGSSSSAERDQQPEADPVRHDRDARSEQPARRERTADRLHPGRAASARRRPTPTTRRGAPASPAAARSCCHGGHPVLAESRPAGSERSPDRSRLRLYPAGGALYPVEGDARSPRAGAVFLTSSVECFLQ